MKKNTMMRLASFLLIAVLITTSAISGTYAKYVTQDSASDSARVAKWGVELQVVGNLYGSSYVNNIVKEATDNGDNVRVWSVDHDADVVAPGTQNTGEGFTFSLKGQPEVDGIVTTTMKIQNIFLKNGSYGVMIPVDDGVVTEANFAEFQDDLYKLESGAYTKVDTFTAGTALFTLEDEADVDDEYYYPVVYHLAGNTATTGSYNEDSLKKAADAIASKLNLTAGEADSVTAITYTGNKSFNANTDLAGWAIDGETLTWAWAFDGVNDGADTILGMLKNTTEGTVVKLDGTSYVALTEYTDYCLDTQFSIDITVTQVN